mmetsp:Transcript_19722/g.62080  ORF Transcript_19722/g.62080 Transcript_19722/m.62080 type:complete len:284 (-) Transcript_19722:850-1701(-)
MERDGRPGVLPLSLFSVEWRSGRDGGVMETDAAGHGRDGGDVPLTAVLVEVYVGEVWQVGGEGGDGPLGEDGVGGVEGAGEVEDAEVGAAFVEGGEVVVVIARGLVVVEVGGIEIAVREDGVEGEVDEVGEGVGEGGDVAAGELEADDEGGEGGAHGLDGPEGLGIEGAAREEDELAGPGEGGRGVDLGEVLAGGDDAVEFPRAARDGGANAIDVCERDASVGDGVDERGGRERGALVGAERGDEEGAEGSGEWGAEGLGEEFEVAGRNAQEGELVALAERGD